VKNSSKVKPMFNNIGKPHSMWNMPTLQTLKSRFLFWIFCFWKIGNLFSKILTFLSNLNFFKKNHHHCVKLAPKPHPLPPKERCSTTLENHIPCKIYSPIPFEIKIFLFNFLVMETLVIFSQNFNIVFYFKISKIKCHHCVETCPP